MIVPFAILPPPYHEPILFCPSFFSAIDFQQSPILMKGHYPEAFALILPPQIPPDLLNMASIFHY